MKIYNTLSKRKEEFVPLEENRYTYRCADLPCITSFISEMHVL